MFSVAQSSGQTPTPHQPRAREPAAFTTSSIMKASPNPQDDLAASLLACRSNVWLLHDSASLVRLKLPCEHFCGAAARGVQVSVLHVQLWRCRHLRPFAAVYPVFGDMLCRHRERASHPSLAMMTTHIQLATALKTSKPMLTAKQAE